ncbi:hypothetical protein [uncultured Microbacterium sp.]|uniref:hypothetical protein n=1 Tax=uncultured Microbacterium sp. TaxID=191216 RepID=UPI0028D3CF67|nr:hypothetical protein [uncultured Microbacterium sp.]
MGITVTDQLPSPPHVATLVVDEALTKLEGLDVISRTLGASIERAGTSRPFIALGASTRVEIEIPKFGEAPPLALDVSSSESVADARSAALELMNRLTAATRWRIIPMFAD